MLSKKHIISMLAALLLALPVWANVPADSVNSEAARINREAASSDFIHVSLLIATEGARAYQAFGHAALRLQCPSKHLDVCFSFERLTDWVNDLKFPFDKAKAGFEALPTAVFLQQYREVGRGVTAYPLNLLPREKQQLWQNLDNEVAAGPQWQFQLTKVTCVSMVAYAVNAALIDERLQYGRLPAEATQNFGAVVDSSLMQRPWTCLLLKILNLRQINQRGDADEMLTPHNLVKAWQNATFTDAAGHRRPVLLPGSRQLLPATLTISAPLITPAMAAVALVVIITGGLAFVLWKRKNKTHSNTH